MHLLYDEQYLVNVAQQVVSSRPFPPRDTQCQHPEPSLRLDLQILDQDPHVDPGSVRGPTLVNPEEVRVRNEPAQLGKLQKNEDLRFNEHDHNLRDNDNDLLLAEGKRILAGREVALADHGEQERDQKGLKQKFFSFHSTSLSLLFFHLSQNLIHKKMSFEKV